jgi:hypothetical protein
VRAQSFFAVKFAYSAGWYVDANPNATYELDEDLKKPNGIDA